MIDCSEASDALALEERPADAADENPSLPKRVVRRVTIVDGPLTQRDLTPETLAEFFRPKGKSKAKSGKVGEGEGKETEMTAATTASASSTAPTPARAAAEPDPDPCLEFGVGKLVVD